ncbi:hypothetical protein H4219_000196 [Mycoemilia scoparia]|uniref:E2 ubiquitin-conjugating enzyme n=1 Tax=Mycoemilia scoparia TaxID=417184 RepID=A0A9W8ACR9_9FUNG|nr:hypothetical protein H4219_000196 [Mycoemilia scoparia]
MSGLSMQATKALLKDLARLQRTPPEGIILNVNGDDITDIQAWIQGPASTPYQDGVFKIKLSLSEDFPNSPPKGHFLTKIFHPNVSESGEICVNTLKKDWNRQLGIEHILITIKCLLIYPNPESALNEEAGKLLLEQYDAYSRHAALMTSIHAQNKGSIEFPVYNNEDRAKSPSNTENTLVQNNVSEQQQQQQQQKETTKPVTKEAPKAVKKKDKKSGLRRL